MHNLRIVVAFVFHLLPFAFLNLLLGIVTRFDNPEPFLLTELLFVDHFISLSFAQSVLCQLSLWFLSDRLMDPIWHFKVLDQSVVVIRVKPFSRTVLFDKTPPCFNVLFSVPLLVHLLVELKLFIVARNNLIQLLISIKLVLLRCFVAVGV